MAYDEDRIRGGNTSDLPPNMVAQPRTDPNAPRPQVDPVTGQPVVSFMNNPGVQRMLAMQAAGGTGRAPMPGGGGVGSLPMLQMLAPYLSQQRGGGMSPLLAQLLPMMMQQQGGGMAGMMGGPRFIPQGAQAGAGGFDPRIAQMAAMMQQRRAG